MPTEDVQAPATLDDVVAALDQHFATTNQLQQTAYDGLVTEVDKVVDAVGQMQTSTQDVSGAEMLAAGLRVMATEGLCIVILLAVITGLMSFRIFTHKW